jgi:hypothetical protein
MGSSSSCTRSAKATGCSAAGLAEHKHAVLFAAELVEHLGRVSGEQDREALSFGLLPHRPEDHADGEGVELVLHLIKRQG